MVLLFFTISSFVLSASLSFSKLNCLLGWFMKIINKGLNTQRNSIYDITPPNKIIVLLSTCINCYICSGAKVCVFEAYLEHISLHKGETDHWNNILYYNVFHLCQICFCRSTALCAGESPLKCGSLQRLPEMKSNFFLPTLCCKGWMADSI